MDLRRWLMGSCLGLAAMAQAAEGVDIAGKGRVQAVAAAVPQTGEAPFARGIDPYADLFSVSTVAAAPLAGSVCERNRHRLCYDAAERRVVYRAAADYMPRVEGLTAESISLRHDRLILKYSFR